MSELRQEINRKQIKEHRQKALQICTAAELDQKIEQLRRWQVEYLIQYLTGTLPVPSNQIANYAAQIVYLEHGLDLNNLNDGRTNDFCLIQ